MAYVTWSLETLERFCSDVFEAFGFEGSDGAKISDVLLTADLYGIESHGMQRMVRYHKGIEKGQIHRDAEPEIVFESPVSAVIDGHSGMGQLIGIYAMEKAIEKAKASGVGIVSVRESNHYGIAGYYAQMASDQGLIGFSCTNSEAIMVPTFSRQAMIGSNPIAIAVPADPYPFLFDASTTVVTRGKLEMYNKMGKPLPDGWALDENGSPCDEAPRVLSNIVGKNGGGIMPLGGPRRSEATRVTDGASLPSSSARSCRLALRATSAARSPTRRASATASPRSTLLLSATRKRSRRIFPSIWQLCARPQWRKAPSRFTRTARRKCSPRPTAAKTESP